MNKKDKQKVIALIKWYGGEIDQWKDPKFAEQPLTKKMIEELGLKSLFIMDLKKLLE